MDMESGDGFPINNVEILPLRSIDDDSVKDNFEITFLQAQSS